MVAGIGDVNVVGGFVDGEAGDSAEGELAIAGAGGAEGGGVFVVGGERRGGGEEEGTRGGAERGEGQSEAAGHAGAPGVGARDEAWVAVRGAARLCEARTATAALRSARRAMPDPADGKTL